MKKYLPIFISLFLLLQPIVVKAQSDLPPETAACNQNTFGSLALNWNDCIVYGPSSIDFEESSLSLEIPNSYEISERFKQDPPYPKAD